MSDVLERYRSISSQEFFRVADELDVDITKFMLREKNVPKKYRAIAVYPLLEAFDELFELMEDANRIRADTPEKVKERRAAQQKCIDQLDTIYRRMRKAVNIVWKDKIRGSREHPPTAEQQRLRNALNDYAMRLQQEDKLLTGWRNGTKLIGEKNKK